MANRTKRTEKATERFLEALRTGASVSKAAAAAGVGRSTAYEWREADPAFSAAWDAAFEEWTDALEDEAVRRAHEGVPREHFYKGEVCGYTQHFSDRLLEMMLSARRPAVYGAKVQHSGKVDTGLEALLAAIDGKSRLLPKP